MRSANDRSAHDARQHADVAQPLVIRITHWLNVPLLVIMGGSGLQILLAYPYMGPRGDAFGWYPFQGFRPPAWLCLGGWLAGARALHFAFGWFFVINGLAFIAYELATGEWRARAFLPRRDFANAVATALHYLRLKKAPPEQGFYNGLQRLAYTSAVALGAVSVLSGLAIWKPVQLSWLETLFGGYDVARCVHFFSLIALAVFTVVHVLLVSVHPKTIVDMVAGGTKRGSPDR
jgi:thiosulfate reductase cytochrome b subunit